MMRMHRMLVAVLALSSPASAQDAPAAFDPAAMTSCLNAAAEPAAKHACVGMASGTCMNAPGGDSTAGMSGCFDAERAWWDARLNEDYNELAEVNRTADKATSGVDGAVAQAPALKAAEKAWLAYRDAECAYQQGFFAGGSGSGPATLACQMNLTALRAIELRESLLAAQTR